MFFSITFLECGCFEKGSAIGYCDPYGGQCHCVLNHGGRKCDQCAPGFKMGENGICECKLLNI